MSDQPPTRIYADNCDRPFDLDQGDTLGGISFQQRTEGSEKMDIVAIEFDRPVKLESGDSIVHTWGPGNTIERVQIKKASGKLIDMGYKVIFSPAYTAK